MWEEYFEKSILVLIERHAPETSTVAPEVLTRMLRLWIFDAGVNAFDVGTWWSALADLKGMDEQVKRFVDAMIASFTFFLQMLAEHDLLGTMLKNYMTRATGEGSDRAVGKRREDPLYRWLVEAVRDDLLLSVPLLCQLGGEMSGDMFGIGATMLVNTSVRVLVGQEESVLDHTGDIKAFLDICDSKRVAVVPKRDMMKESFKVMQTLKTVHWITSYNLGTMYLGSEGMWANEWARTRIRDAWGVSDDGGFKPMCSGLVQWLGHMGLPIGRMVGAQVLVLWSRFTGKKGEIHVEHDTSFTGTRQLAQCAVDLGYYVIITGDKPLEHLAVKDKLRRARKFDTICDELNAELDEAQVFNLTGFWQDLTWKQLAKTRTDQFRLFELLHRMCDVRHLGMRSGNLEAMALMGFRVSYMEEKESWGGDRMSVWHGIGLGYERILIDAPPTRTGKYVVEEFRTKHTRTGNKSKDPPKMLKWIVDRNVGVGGTVGDPSRVKDKPQKVLTLGQQQKIKIQEEKRRRRDERLKGRPEASIDTSTSSKEEVVSFTVKKTDELTPSIFSGTPRPVQIEELPRGFTQTDLKKVLGYLGSPDTARRYDKLPWNWSKDPLTGQIL